MERCPRCGADLETFSLWGREQPACPECSYVGVSVHHGSDRADPESWQTALERFREKGLDGATPAAFDRAAPRPPVGDNGDGPVAATATGDGPDADGGEDTAVDGTDGDEEDPGTGTGGKDPETGTPNGDDAGTREADDTGIPEDEADAAESPEHEDEAGTPTDPEADREDGNPGEDDDAGQHTDDGDADGQGEPVDAEQA